MTKYFCDRCGREILNQTGCCTIKRKSLIYEDNEMTPGTLKEIPSTLLCDRCELILTKFIKNELDINYGPNPVWLYR